MEHKERYRSNVNAFSWQEMEIISSKRVCIIGCGGLGGFVAQALARFGVGFLTVVDGDAFQEKNLNRQIFATPQTLGQNKALVCLKTLEIINQDISVKAEPVMLTDLNAGEILQSHDLVIDCLDNVKARFIAVKHCQTLGIPVVHGAIGGFYGHVVNIFPNDELLQLLYPQGEDSPPGLEATMGNPVFTPQLVAAVQCCEALKILAGRNNVLRNAMLHIDMLDNSYDVIYLR